MNDDVPTRPPVRSYRTDFPLTENPISEQGAWLNGRKDGIDWIDVISGGGYAYGEVSRMTVAERRIEQGNLAPGDSASAPVGDYDDPTAVLDGVWGRNQHGKATVYCLNPTDEYFQEVQIRLRSSIRPHYCSGYEVFWRCLKEDEGYAEIVRWNGKVGDWISLARHVGVDYGVEHGDVVEATVFGDVIKGFINGVEVITVTDAVIKEGSPGMGFNFYVGHTNVDHGFSSFEVDTWDD
jgi:hypothetical protein